MNSFDAPLPPSSFLTDCDPALGASSEAETAIGNLVRPGLADVWRTRNGHAPPSTTGPARTYYDRSKRLIDITLSFCAIVCLAPVFPVVGLIIVLTSPGPVIFRQKRLGLGGKVFWCYKFRTMVADAEERLRRDADLARRYQGTFKIKNDPRVTQVGSFLRRTSLDELPQLYNVLRGDISLIGPRPIVESEELKYGVHATKLLSVKPGLSGVWQVYGRNDTTYEQRVSMDMDYIDHRSLWVDLKLIVLTAYIVLRGRETC